MGFREKMQERYAKSYLEKYGDRLAQVQGNVVSIKVEEKAVLWIFHKLKIVMLVRPERSKQVVQCSYAKNKWFKKPEFIPINQGNLVIVQAMKSKKGKKGKEKKEILQIMNVINQTNKKELFPTKGKPQKTVIKNNKMK